MGIAKSCTCWSEGTGVENDPVKCTQCQLRTRVDHNFMCERCGANLQVQLSAKAKAGTRIRNEMSQMQYPEDFPNLVCCKSEVKFAPNLEAPWGIACNFAEPLVSLWKVTRVTPNQQAYTKGVVRGWRMLKVNDTEVTQDNKEDVLNILKTGGECKICFLFLHPIWKPTRYLMKKRMKLQQSPELDSDYLKDEVQVGEIVYILDATIVDGALRGEVHDATTSKFESMVRGWVSLYTFDTEESFVKSMAKRKRMPEKTKAKPIAGAKDI